MLHFILEGVKIEFKAVELSKAGSQRECGSTSAVRQHLRQVIHKYFLDIPPKWSHKHFLIKLDEKNQFVLKS
jgi:hypothetical protein